MNVKVNNDIGGIAGCISLLVVGAVIVLFFGWITMLLFNYVIPVFWADAPVLSIWESTGVFLLLVFIGELIS